VLVAAAEHVGGHGVTGQRGGLEPEEGFDRVSLDAPAIQQPLAEDGLRFGMPALGGAGQPARRAVGRAGQHGMDRVDHRRIRRGSCSVHGHQYRMPSVRIAARPGAIDA
jgi:hypothetical protein